MSDTTATNGTVATAEPKTERQAALKRAAAKVGADKPMKAKKAGKTPKTKVVPDQVNKEIRYTPAKIALLTALKRLGASSATTARNVTEITKASKGAIKENQVAHQVNPHFDLSAQEIIKRIKPEEGIMSYYLTAKGAKALAKVTGK